MVLYLPEYSSNYFPMSKNHIKMCNVVAIINTEILCNYLMCTSACTVLNCARAIGGLRDSQGRPRGVRDRARLAQRGARPRLRERREQSAPGHCRQAREGLAHAQRAQVLLRANFIRSLCTLVHGRGFYSYQYTLHFSRRAVHAEYTSTELTFQIVFVCVPLC